MILFEGVFVAVKAFQLPSPLLSISVHRRILLMTENDTIARLAFPRTLPTLPTDWLLLIAFELSLAAGLAAMVNQQLFHEVFGLLSGLSHTIPYETSLPLLHRAQCE